MVLERLAVDMDYVVRRGVSENPNVSTEVLEHLAGDEDPGVRKGAAKNPGTPASVREHVARNDDDLSVRWAAAAILLRPFISSSSTGHQESVTSGADTDEAP